MSETNGLAIVPVKRYSEALKRQVVREIDSGKHTWQSARKHYGIDGHETVQRWHRRYSHYDRRGFAVRMITSKEQQEDQQQQRIRDLEHALADAQLQIRALNTLIDLAEETYRIPVRKNSGAKQSNDFTPGAGA